VTLLGDAATSLQWALDHAGSAVWLLVFLGGLVGWASKKQRKALARSAALTRPATQPPGAVAYAAPAAPAAPRATVSAMPPRTAAVRPAAASMDAVVVRPGSPVLHGAFGDPAHARTAVILAEVLAPPVALR
jgi:hypothetical protein